MPNKTGKTVEHQNFFYGNNNVTIYVTNNNINKYTYKLLVSVPEHFHLFRLQLALI